MSAGDPLTARFEARVLQLSAADARARATDAAAHLRKAIDLLLPVARAPELDRVETLLDDAATILVAFLETGF